MMSSSPSRAPLQPVVEGASLSHPEPFPYDAISGEAFTEVSGHLAVPTLTPADQFARKAAALEAQAHEKGRQQGLAESRKVFDEQLAAEHSAIADALAQFTRDRAVYFHKIEIEVVQLALAIAQKILHREAQVDPLLLAGITRVALEQIDGATGVVLRLNPQVAADWQRYLNMHLQPSDLPQIVEDPAQPADRCSLETSMGAAVIGLDIQLKEIEQGLMDLLAARPESRNAR